MTADNSFPLPYRLVTVERDYGPYMRGAVWADPDLDEAARLLRVIVDHPEAARARGVRAQQQVSQERNPAVTGAVLRERLNEIRNAREIRIPWMIPRIRIRSRIRPRRRVRRWMIRAILASRGRPT